MQSLHTRDCIVHSTVVRWHIRDEWVENLTKSPNQDSYLFSDDPSDLQFPSLPSSQYLHLEMAPSWCLYFPSNVLAPFLFLLLLIFVSSLFPTVHPSFTCTYSSLPALCFCVLYACPATAVPHRPSPCYCSSYFVQRIPLCMSHRIILHLWRPHTGLYFEAYFQHFYIWSYIEIFLDQYCCWSKS